eukprot:825271_1
MVISAKSVSNLNDDQRDRFWAFLTNSIGSESSENGEITESLLDSWGVIRIFLVERPGDMILATALLASNDLSAGHLSVIGLCYDAEFPDSGRQVLESVVATKNERFPNHCLSAEIARGNARMHSVLHDLGFVAGEAGTKTDWITFTLAAGYDTDGSHAVIPIEEHTPKSESSTQLAENTDSSKHNFPASNEVECNVCQIRFVSNSELKKHILSVHEGKCSLCQKTFSNIANLRRHIQHVHNTTEGNAVCTLCQEEFSDQSVLNNHSKSVHSNSHIQCERCGKMYMSAVTLAHHMREVHGKVLTEHVQTVHQHRTVCVVCNSSFSNKSNLLQHVRAIHEKLKTFACEREPCQKSFKTKSELNKHMKYVHDKAKGFKCDVCHKDFQRNYALQLHITRVHTVRRCKVCQKSFKNKYDLKSHAIVHSETRRFPCQLCKSAFKHKWTLIEHVKCVHEKLRPFKCDVCSRAFGRKSDMKKHILARHGKLLN